MHLTKSEQQIMEIFWQADHAMAQTEVVKTCVDRKWKERSIFSMLNSLMEKGVLREVGFVRSGKTYARTFEPAMSHAEYLASVIAEQLPAKQLPELIAALMQLYMPTLRKPQRLRLGEQARILRNPFFVANVALSVLVFTAIFTAYTYLAAMLEHVAGVPPAQIGWWLMGFGAVGLVGNWLGGRWVDQHPLKTTAAFCLLLAVGMAATMLSVDAWPWLALALAVWGVANTALYPICQIRVMQSASHAQALAGTLNVSAANAGIALGAVLGGLSVSAWGAGSVGYVAAGIALLAVAAVPLVAWLGTLPQAGVVLNTPTD